MIFKVVVLRAFFVYGYIQSIEVPFSGINRGKVVRVDDLYKEDIQKSENGLREY